MNFLSVDVLESNVMQVFRHAGLSEKHAAYVADGLLKASLRGVDTHGIELLPTYIDEIVAGRSKSNPNIVINQKGSILKIDADDALGLVAGGVAIERGLELCRETGVAVVSVANSNHFGMASVYTLTAARAGFIAIAMSHADALIAPFNGVEKLLGTNPLSFAAPAGGDDIFCLDIASSQVSFSKVQAYLRAGRPLEKGWAIDRAGNDSAETKEVHALQPLGGYKGQGIGMMVTILAGILSSMPLDYEMHHLFSPPYEKPRKNGHFFLILDIASFADKEMFCEQLQRFLNRIRASERVDEETAVVTPGDIEAGFEKTRVAEGIPVSDKLMEYFRNFSSVLA